MATSDVAALKDALRDALERRGVMGDLRATMRREIFSAMEDPQDVRPHLASENLLINELIREYLAFNEYKHTLAVFLPETGQPEEPLDRTILAQRTHLPCQAGSAGSVPLLYALLSSPERTKTDHAMLPALPQPASTPQKPLIAPPALIPRAGSSQQAQPAAASTRRAAAPPPIIF